jgi:phospholipid/cholesterol/gamma-HCH transport system permease protein
MTRAAPDTATIHVEGTWVRCAGAWTSLRLSEVEWQLDALRPPQSGRATFDLHAVTALDTAGAWLLHRSMQGLAQQGVAVSSEGLSPDAQAMLDLVSGQTPAGAKSARPAMGVRFLNEIGRTTVGHVRQNLGFLAFVGELAATSLPLVLRPTRLRWKTILSNLQAAGVDALPIVGMLAFLLGIVIGYQGGIPLRDYGATLFVADLVGLAMVRELAPLITAIIVAGRTGSAYTAQIGTMKVTEEIDALRTIGITPMELLVLPKVLALMVVLPLLTVYSDIIGILGGMVMAKAVLDMTFTAFIERLGDAVDVGSYLIGIGKAPVFAAIIACVGCYQGFRVSGSAESVGRQTTISVVQAIFLVLVVDAGFSVIFSILGI